MHVEQIEAELHNKKLLSQLEESSDRAAFMSDTADIMTGGVSRNIPRRKDMEKEAKMQALLIES